MVDEAGSGELSGTAWGRVRFGARRAPAVAVAVPVGVLVAGVLGVLAAWAGLGTAQPLLTGAVMAACTAPVAIVGAWAVVVDRATLRGAVADPERSVESEWYRDAAMGAFHDTMIVAGLALAVVSIGRFDLDGWIALLGVVVVMMASFFVHYVIARSRG